MKKKIICLILTLVMIVGAIGVLSSCGKKPDTGNGGTHTCVDNNQDGKCDICKKVLQQGGGTNDCEHVDEDDDQLCDECGEEYIKPVPWDNKTLLFKMTNNSNSNELSSTCGRYLAGEVTGTVEDLDTLVMERNADALYLTKVSVTYTYYDESSANSWSNVVKQIVEEITSGSSKDLPDMYVNFVYDMVAASLNGCFANLLSDTKGTNYFAFNSDSYLEYGQENPDPEKDRGYMYEYMRSTTLSNSKMYILASDYFIDMVRAFFVVPVNVALLERVGEGITGDRNDDGYFDIDDFYAAVNNNEWTYDLVARYSSAISTSASASGQTLDDTIGFALPTGGLPASGILYSTNITVVKRDWSTSDNDYTYSYPQENNDLYEMADALKNLMEQAGVIAPSGSEDTTKKYGSTGLLAVRARFCQNEVLFGGIECVGALEDQTYQSLKVSTGFGVVPVPLYKAPEEGATKTYLTSIHNVGRPGGISRQTKNFDACTAFLNYQSTHSEEILEEYYTTKLQYGATDGKRGTVDMLDFIRNNVRTSFDKTMEDAIGYKFDVQGDRWHSILSNKGYKCDIRQPYASVIGNKEERLKDLQASYADYPA